MTQQIFIKAKDVKRGDIFDNGEWAKEDAYQNGEVVIINTSAGIQKYYPGEMIAVERN